MNTTPAPLTADIDVMQTWITHLYAGAPGLISVCSDADKWAGRRFATDDDGIAAAAAYAMQLDQRKPQGIYVQVTTLREDPPSGRGGEDLAHTLTHLWADGDYGTVGHKPGPDDLPAPPDIESVAKVVAESSLPAPSGWSYSGGGANPVWMLAAMHTIRDADDRARIKQLSMGLQTILAAQAHRCGWSWDTEVGNLDRLMKLPGSINRKEGLERPTAIGPGNGLLYELDELADVIAQLEPAAQNVLAQAAKEKQERRRLRLGIALPPPRTARVRPRLASTGDGPLDVLAELLQFRDILEPAGFTYEGTHTDGREKWLRPAADGDRASSAYSLVCDDHVAVNWSERADLPVGAQTAGSKLTIGTLYAHLNYGGDVSGAARDIMRAAAGRTTHGPAGQLPQQVLAEVKRRCLPASTTIPTDGQGIDWGDLAEPAAGHSVNSVRHSQGGEEWEEPLSIDRPKLKPFPTHLLGTNLAKVVDAVTDQVQVAPDIPAMIALATIATAVGGRARVRIRDGWSEASSVWTATVAGAGERKSAAEGPFSETLRDVERQLQAKAIPEIEDAEQEVKIAQARLEDAEKAAIKAKPDNRALMMDQAKLAKRELAELGPVPAPPRLLFGDITPAAMAQKAAAQGGRMAVIHSEGTLIKQMGGLYNSGASDTGFALDAYDGKAMPVDRIGRDTIQMDSAHLSIGLLVQPIILEQLGRKKDDEMLHNGFVQRFLYAFPTSRLGYQDPRGSKAIPEAVLADLHDRLSALVNGLWKSPLARAVTFTEQASEDMYVFQEEQQARLRRGGDLHQIASWASKLPGKLARIAALITLYEDPAATQVTAERLAQALALAPYFIAHARLCLDLMGANKDAKLTPARDVLDWLRRRKDDKAREPFTVRDAQRGVDGNAWGPDGVTSETVADAIAVLVDRGWVAPLPAPERPEGQRGRLPSPRFAPHPLVYDENWKKKEVSETRLRSA
ncbi:YfjI family protein [Streptomyces sp. NPDC008141]|uniref:YfjI family protein n=1 Tax=Streptomyces sp. NPDC008141 TaxID=3364815 RepID=UPI0036E64A69